MTTVKMAWVISIKLQTGCYRHLQVPKSTSLADFAGSILWSFGFYNDHAHAFFMDNKLWGDDAYYLSYVDIEEEYPHTEDHDLKSLRLKQKFKFLFDFGDCWEFQCQVLREVPDEGDTYLVREVGKAPEQYPNYDEDWDDV